MVRRSSLVSYALLALAFVAGCSENPVGRRCFIGEAPDPSQASIASPALECASRTCLHMPGQGEGESDLCTAECDSEDDCDKVPESPCESGFTCGVAVVVGPFCCRKVCICKDYVVIPDGGMPALEACDPDLEQNTCCNLPGREDLAACQ
jgi:hypothetical protein